MSGAQFLNCAQLIVTQNWQSAFRDDALGVVSATSPDQRLRCSEIGRCKTLGEPIIDRREEPMGFLGSTLVAP